MREVREDCFWYRPWHDMGAKFDQCDVSPTAECPCSPTCKWYISKASADNLVWDELQLRVN